MRTLYFIDAIDRDTTEDPVYLDKLKTIEHGRIVLSLGDRESLLSNKQKNRIFGICYWKFIQGHYLTKSWEAFLGFPIGPDGVTWIMDTCPDAYCGTQTFRDPKETFIYCPSCKRKYHKPWKKKINTFVFEKYITKIKKQNFCQACGKANPPWISEDTKLCEKCFPKYGDSSFTNSNDGTKISFPSSIILSVAKKGSKAT